MGLNMLDTVLIVVAVYALLGVLFALWFVTLGVSRLDQGARGGPIGFRVLIFPASAALWPVLALKLARRPREAGA